MIKVNYDSTTGTIKGFYPDDIAYAIEFEKVADVS